MKLLSTRVGKEAIEIREGLAFKQRRLSAEVSRNGT